MPDTTTTAPAGDSYNVEPPSATPLLYFAVGAMMNAVSVTNRGISLVSSAPGELLHHKLGLFSSLGFAEALPTEDEAVPPFMM